MKEELIKKIDRVRDYMHDLISKKDSLTDPEVVLASQMLDYELNEYNRLFN
ncbi:aspartyl-phosphate phosphatase Spo0E family protein [Clostridium sp. DJ247]|uniref:aspartyl-phosphate phosphatase Spo0E family protein n=1 Tax=Clostridium sp. DJ247 TaxID=2726188 RepID=UPI0016265EF7|nr:aspartyl-phosphate phosphatase Spo0E family protein [Clostridium sp. DJ247]